MRKTAQRNQGFKKAHGNTVKVPRSAAIKIKSQNIGKFLKSERGEFGMSAILGIAIGLIIAAFVLIPGLRNFADTIITAMNSWWTTSISSNIFPTSYVN